MPKIKVRIKKRISKPVKSIAKQVVEIPQRKNLKEEGLLADTILNLDNGKPNIKDLVAVFDTFSVRNRAIKIACMREPYKWNKEYEALYKSLFARLAELGLAKHLNWNIKKERTGKIKTAS